MCLGKDVFVGSSGQVTSDGVSKEPIDPGLELVNVRTFEHVELFIAIRKADVLVGGVHRAPRR